MEKRERGSNIIFPMILSRFGRISCGEEVASFWEENTDKNGIGRILSCRELYSPLIKGEDGHERKHQPHPPWVPETSCGGGGPPVRGGRGLEARQD